MNENQPAHPVSQTPAPSISSVPVIEEWTVVKYKRDAIPAWAWKVMHGEKQIAEDMTKGAADDLANDRNATVRFLTETQLQVEAILDDAGHPIGDEQRKYSLPERVEGLVRVKNYFVRQTDSLRTQLQEAEKIKELEEKDASPDNVSAVLQKARALLQAAEDDALACLEHPTKESAAHTYNGVLAVTSVLNGIVAGAPPVPENDSSFPVPLQEAQSRPVADTERLDWLDKLTRIVGTGMMYEPYRAHVCDIYSKTEIRSLREAIDAAMSASSKASEENKTDLEGKDA